MKTEIKNSTVLGNYLFDINIKDSLYITLNKSKIDTNGENYKQYTTDVIEIEGSQYYLGVYDFNKNIVLTVIENETNVNSQFLITSIEECRNLETEDLTDYMNNEVANLIIGYFD